MTKKIRLLTAIAMPLAVLPLIASSCKKEKEDSQQNSGYQKRVLKDSLTKNRVLTWLTDIYISEFYKSEIESYAKNFKDKDKIEYIVSNFSNSALTKDLYELFKYYATNRVASDPQFFWNLKSLFINAKIDTTNYNPAAFSIPSEQEFKFIFKHSNQIAANIRLELQKMLLAKLYLLKNRPELKKIANDSNGLDKAQVALHNKMSKKDAPINEKELYEALNFADDSLYLMKYLVENPIIENWEFNDKRDMNLRWPKSYINSIEGFNKLASYNPSTKPEYGHNEAAKNPEQLINSGSMEGDVLKSLLAYKGIVKNSNTSGDLGGNLDSIKKDLSSVYGFVDPYSKKVYSQESFLLAKILAQEINHPKAKATETLQSKASKGELKSFDYKDYEFDGLTKDSKDNYQYTKTITLGSKQYTLRFSQKGSISFDGNFLTIPMNLTVDGLGKRNFYEFNAKLEYNKNTKKFESIKQDVAYNLKQNPQKINVTKDNSITAQYVVKISPLYLTKKVKDYNGKEVTKQVLTFDETPWATKEKQEIIANNIVTANFESLYKTAVKYINELGFKLNVSETNKSVYDILKVEGLV